MNNLHKLPTGTPEELRVFAVNTLTYFFDNYDLSECHRLLRQFVKLGFTNTDDTLGVHDRQNLIYFYENLHEMITAASTLHSSSRTEQLLITN